MTQGLPAIVLDFLFPQPCLLCGESLLADRAPPPWTRLPLCGECLEGLAPITGRRCRRCSLPLVSEHELCTRCRQTDYPFAANWSLFEYAGAARELISQYKFRNERSLARFFGDSLAALLAERFPGLPVVPVPSRRRSVRKRGWDHIGTIACRLAAGGAEVVPLLRRDNGRSQKTLDYAHRLTNLHGRIHWAPKLPAGRALPREVVLLDDVFTTGATASECARILKERGVGEVWVVTLAVD